MNFTQFMFPNGRRVAEWISRPDAIEALAGELRDAGWSFEIECNPDTQLIHMDCCDEDEAIANRICRNGPDVPVKVDELVKEAHALWIERGKPRPLVCGRKGLNYETRGLPYRLLPAPRPG